jgi:hypothetical protein
MERVETMLARICSYLAMLPNRRQHARQLSCKENFSNLDDYLTMVSLQSDDSHELSVALWYDRSHGS